MPASSQPVSGEPARSPGSAAAVAAVRGGAEHRQRQQRGAGGGDRGEPRPRPPDPVAAGLPDHGDGMAADHGQRDQMARAEQQHDDAVRGPGPAGRPVERPEQQQGGEHGEQAADRVRAGLLRVARDLRDEKQQRPGQPAGHRAGQPPAELTGEPDGAGHGDHRRRAHGELRDAEQRGPDVHEQVVRQQHRVDGAGGLHDPAERPARHLDGRHLVRAQPAMRDAVAAEDEHGGARAERGQQRPEPPARRLGCRYVCGGFRLCPADNSDSHPRSMLDGRQRGL
jgi:hypothetical protein